MSLVVFDPGTLQWFLDYVRGAIGTLVSVALPLFGVVTTIFLVRHVFKKFF